MQPLKCEIVAGEANPRLTQKCTDISWGCVAKMLCSQGVVWGCVVQGCAWGFSGVFNEGFNEGLWDGVYVGFAGGWALSNCLA